MPKANTRARGARAVRRNTQVSKNDVDLTLAEWKKLSTEVLRLKCQDLNLITTGKNAELAQRLYDKHHPVVPTPRSSSTSGMKKINWRARVARTTLSTTAKTTPKNHCSSTTTTRNNAMIGDNRCKKR